MKLQDEDRRTKQKGVTLDLTVNLSTLITLSILIGSMIVGFVRADDKQTALTQMEADNKKAAEIRFIQIQNQIDKMSDTLQTAVTNQAVTNQILLQQQSQLRKQ